MQVTSKGRPGIQKPWKRMVVGALYAAVLVPVPVLAIALCLGSFSSAAPGSRAGIGEALTFDGPTVALAKVQAGDEVGRGAAQNPAELDAQTVTTLDDWTFSAPPPKTGTCPPGTHNYVKPGGPKCGVATTK